MNRKIITFMLLVEAFALLGWHADAQTDQAPDLPPPGLPPAAASWHADAQTDQAPSPYWVVKGQIYDINKSSLWTRFDGTILKVLTNGLVVATFTMEPEYQAVSVTGDDGIHIKPQLMSKKVQVGEKKVSGKLVIIRNYPLEESPAVGKTIAFYAMQTGTSDYNGDRLELWDLGTPPTAEDFRKLKADANERQRAAQNQLDEQRRVASEKAVAAKKAIQDKKKAATDKVVKYNQDLADKGDEYGLLRMGERYRDGDGVPKDLAKAKDYLTKAAAAGSPTAADELKTLPSN